jgi:hypothetical protein
MRASNSNNTATSTYETAVIFGDLGDTLGALLRHSNRPE